MGYIVNIFDNSRHLPTNNSHRAWTFGVSERERQHLRPEFPASELYGLNERSDFMFTEDQTNNRVCAVFERVRANNSEIKVLFILDTYSSHPCEYARRNAQEREIRQGMLTCRFAPTRPGRIVVEEFRWLTPIAESSRCELKERCWTILRRK